MTQRLVWERDGVDWPHREASRFVQSAGLRWHVQEFGQRSSAKDTVQPVALLIHGTGASTHTWRGIAPLLAHHFNVLTLDLPGHGFTDMPPEGRFPSQFSLPGMATSLGSLLTTLEMTPDLVVGHSAGAAIGVRMCLDGLIAPSAVVSLNGAFLPPAGLAGQFFSPVAKFMSAVPFLPQLFSWRAGDPAVLQRLIDGTGSTLDATGLALYAKLVSNPGHAAGALGMMANWDLPQLSRDLFRLKTALCLVVGSNDLTIPPDQARAVLAMLPSTTSSPKSTLTTLPGLGHLAHEERPEIVAAVVLSQFLAAIQG